MKRALSILFALALSVTPALAHGKQKDKGKAHDRSGAKVEVSISFSDDDRAVARAYFAAAHGRGNCPPRLAKKNNGCLPPGQAKKAYAVGRRLAPSVVLLDPPRELVARLRPAPEGYRYVMIDGDLVKLAVPNFLGVDAVEGLVR